MTHLTFGTYPKVLTFLGLCAVALVWATGVHAPFVYDDKIEVIGNPTIRVFTEFSAIATYNVSRPLLIASYAVNWAAGGLDPFGYHVLSIAIHVVNVALVGLVLARLLPVLVPGGSAAAGWTSALLWGVHPMCVQGVTYIAGRSDALCATFWLGASLAWLQRRRGWTLGFLAAALLTKELAVMLPFWLAALRRPEPGERRSVAWMGGLVALGAAVRVGMMGWPQLEITRGFLDQALSQGGAWTRYVGLWLLPVGQSILHDPAWSGPAMIANGALLIGWITTLAAAVGWLLSRDGQTGRALALGWVFIGCWLLPSGILPLKEVMAEHRAYLVGVPTITALCVLLERRDLLWIGAGLGCVLAVATGVQNRIWSSEADLWGAAAALYPESADARFGAADALRLARRWEAAEAGYRAVLELRPEDENALVNLGIVRAEQGDEDGARVIWQDLTLRHPRSCAAHNNLAAFASRHADRRGAMDEYASALKWCPDDPVALVGLGDVCWERGDTRLARKYYQRYLEVLPFGSEAARLRQRVGS